MISISVLMISMDSLLFTFHITILNLVSHSEASTQTTPHTTAFEVPDDDDDPKNPAVQKRKASPCSIRPKSRVSGDRHQHLQHFLRPAYAG